MNIQIQPEGNVSITKTDILTGAVIFYQEPMAQFEMDFGISIPITVKILSYEPESCIFHILRDTGVLDVYKSSDENSYMTMLAFNHANIERRLIELKG